MNYGTTWDKLVDLTDEQYRRLKEARTEQEIVAKVMGQAIYEASCKWSEEDRKFWTCVRQLADAGEDQQVEINWVTHQIGVYTPIPRRDFAARRWAPSSKTEGEPGPGKEG